VLYVLLRYTDSDCPFGIFKLFFLQNTRQLLKEKEPETFDGKGTDLMYFENVSD
jgi:hypothetical protein